MTALSTSLPAVAPLASAAVSYHARVVATDGERFGVNTPAGRHWLRPAASCLLHPSVGDTVLVTLAAGQGYILAVLERGDASPTILQLHGDVRLDVRAGALQVRADAGVDLDAGPALRIRSENATVQAQALAVQADRLDTQGGTSHAVWQNLTTLADQSLTVAARAETRVGTSVRHVSGHDEVTSGSQRVQVQGDWQVRAARATLDAEHRVSIDAAQVQLG